MFVKRSMGEDRRFALAPDRGLLPEEVSADILRYLRKLAEEALGEPVTEAVVTVPAYFLTRPQLMTKRAAELAGFEKVQLLQEPVAAAMMYCLNDPRPNLRIMTYDLGGGTFDVAILDKIEGIISNESVRAFDGDRFLGGYNFDEQLAHWLEDQLNKRGYDLHLSLNDPADRAIFAKLLIYAERAKIALSHSEVYVFQEPSTGICDHAGNPVMIDDIPIERTTFEAMIAVRIEDSIQFCRNAIAAAAEKDARERPIDQIVLVGGSSRIPLVARRLEEEFGLQPRLFQPDLAVALGASIVAQELAEAERVTVRGCLELKEPPKQTSLLSVPVTGHVVPAAGLPQVAGCSVSLASADGLVNLRRTISADGEFSFGDVNVLPEAQTDFVLTVARPNGAVATTHRFSVSQSAEFVERVGAIDPVLAKPILLQCLEGFREIAPAGTRLPFADTVVQQTADTSGTISIPLWEQEHPLGELLLTDIDPHLAVGSSINVTFSIDANFQMQARAEVPDLGREATVAVVIPPPEIKTLDELRKRYEILSAMADDTLRNMARGEKFGNTDVATLQTQLKRCQDILRDQEHAVQNCSELQDKLDQVGALIRKLQGVKLKPPKDVWDSAHAEVRELLEKALAQDKKAAEGHVSTQAAIRAEGDRAFSEKNQAAWEDAHRQLESLRETLTQMLRKKKDDDGPSPLQTLMWLGQELEQVDKRLTALTAKKENQSDSARKNLADFRTEAKDLRSALKAINPAAADWQSTAWGWKTKLDDLRERIERFTETRGRTKPKT
jgi:molecular chaperone DnaK (HSP70)